MKKKIGIVGLGIMGRGMAENFLKKGHEVFVWNRTESVSTGLAEKGAIVAKSPKEVVQNAEIIFEVTATDKSSKKVWYGKKGILSGADSSKILITSATLSIKWTDELIEKCKEESFTFFDMPLTGGRVGAETGNLTLLCGGSEQKLKKISPTLNAIAGKIVYFGREGQGMRFKLILNFIQATHVVAFGQAMRMAKSYKMDLEKVGESLADRPGGVITGIAQRTYFNDPDPITFSIEWIAKDLSYAKKMANNLDISLLDKVLFEYKKAIKKGYAQKDWASINTLDLE